MKRCSWVKKATPLMLKYHDEEWGRPVRDDDRLLFEMLILEGAQAGLSWETVLRKREAYKLAFKNFDIQACSQLKDSYLSRQMQNPDIIRNRLKIFSIPLNAKGVIEIQKEFGSFSLYLWSFSLGEVIKSSFDTSSAYPTRTLLSDEISYDLKRRGFKFVGTTIIYAYLQAVGIVNDHCLDCSFRRPA
jgi:DNA-3-methyladenine glycosylase I